MNDLLNLYNQIKQWLPAIEMSFWVFVALAALICLALLVQLIKVTFAPLVRVCQWLVFHTPGQPLNPAFAGISYGIRLVFWAVAMASLAGFVGWYLGWVDI